MKKPEYRIAERRVINIVNKVWTWDDFVYVEIWHNNNLKDSYFCYAGDIYPNGQIKANAKKFFYSNGSGETICKEVKPILRISNFKHFDKLYFVHSDGEIYRIDGTPAIKCDYIKEAIDLIEK